jgi:hypothetical protein
MAWPNGQGLNRCTGSLGFSFLEVTSDPAMRPSFACAGAASLFIWLSAVIPLARYYSHTVLKVTDTPGPLLVFLYIAGGILTIMLAKYVLVPLLAGQVDVEITEDDIRIKEPFLSLDRFGDKLLCPVRIKADTLLGKNSTKGSPRIISRAGSRLIDISDLMK